jgi:DNA repair protein RadC
MIKKGPREKLLKHGSAHLEDAELLAVIFGHGFKNVPALKLSQQLLTTHKSLRRLLTAPYYDVIKQPGLGTAKYCQLHAAAQISKRILKEPLTRSSVLDSPKNAERYIHAALRDYTYEVFACVFLDYHHQLIEFEILNHGTISFTHIQPRHVIQRALHFNASGIIIAHNHPSGSAEPSEADITVTHTLAQALELFEITLWDHLIIGDQQVVSLSQMGLLK